MGFFKRMFADTRHEASMETNIASYISRFHWFRQTDACRHAIKAAVENALTTFGGIDGYRKLPKQLRDRMEELAAYKIVDELSSGWPGPPVRTAILITKERLRRLTGVPTSQLFDDKTAELVTTLFKLPERAIDFMITEVYLGAFADEELGVGKNWCIPKQT